MLSIVIQDTIQLILISISLLVLLLKSSKTISEIVGFDCLKIISNTILVAILIYYLDTIKDLGLALFSLLDFDNKGESE